MTGYEGTLCGCDDPGAHLQAMLTGEPPRECDEHRRQREAAEAEQQRREQLEGYVATMADAAGLPDAPPTQPAEPQGQPLALNSTSLESKLAAALGAEITTTLD